MNCSWMLTTALVLLLGGKEPPPHQMELAVTTQSQDDWVGKPLPDFEVTGLDGRQYKTSVLKGKQIVMNFWFIACKPCVMEMPELNQLVDQYKSDTTIVFLAPALDAASAVEKFLEQHSFQYALVPSSRQLVSQVFGIRSYPTHLVTDRNGIVRYAASGYNPGVDGKGSSVETLAQAIKKWNKNQ